jgi:hypothetical protein
MKMTQKTAIEAFTDNINVFGLSNAETTAFRCAHLNCAAFSAHVWFKLRDGARKPRTHGGIAIGKSTNSEVIGAKCAACSQEIFFVDGKLVHPKSSLVEPPHPDMPDEIKAEYKEAASIVIDSPRGAAALLRLALQKLLPMIGATETDINKQIGELVRGGIIPTKVQQALDSVRIIGNEAVHPGALDLRDDVKIAGSIFQLLNFVVEKAISEPKKIDEIYSALPEAKLRGVENRDS